MQGPTQDGQGKPPAKAEAGVASPGGVDRRGWEGGRSRPSRSVVRGGGRGLTPAGAEGLT